MGSKKRILIIDDDERNIFALSAILRARGHASLSALEARTGIEQLRQNRNDISIVLLDMMMPDIDGYAALSDIRNQADLQDVPVIAVTAQAMPGDREKCLQAGANDYVSKPVDIDVLLEMINQYTK